VFNEQGTGVPAAKPLRVDVEQTLADLERQLDALQAELAGPITAERVAAGHRIVLEALVDIHALSAFERALGESPRVRTVELRAYAGGWASLVVDVSS
jgi:hypothetical protein